MGMGLGLKNKLAHALALPGPEPGDWLPTLSKHDALQFHYHVVVSGRKLGMH